MTAYIPIIQNKDEMVQIQSTLDMQDVMGDVKHVDFCDVKLKADVWCATIVEIVFLGEIHHTAVAPWRVFVTVLSTILLYITNMVLQLAVTYLFVTEFAIPSLEKFNDLPHHLDIAKATNVLDVCAHHHMPLEGNATFQLPSSAASVVLDLCAEQQAARVLWIYFLMLFLWYAKIGREVVASVHRALQIWNIPERANDDEYMLVKGKLTSLTLKLRIAILLFVIVPKISIAVVLCYAGSIILLVQTDILHIVTKALVLQLIMTFDEVLIATLATTRLESLLHHSSLHYQNYAHVMWENWAGGLFKYTVVAVGAYVYFIYGASGLTAFRSACELYETSLP